MASESDMAPLKLHPATAITDLCSPGLCLQPPPSPSFPILLYHFLGKGAGFQPLHLMCPIDSW